MRPTLALRSGGRYPYPKEVWSPTGGWWVRPANWKSNTAIAFGGVIVLSYAVFRWSAENENFYGPGPRGWIPSMMWTKQGKEGKIKIREEEYVEKVDHH